MPSTLEKCTLFYALELEAAETEREKVANQTFNVLTQNKNYEFSNILIKILLFLLWLQEAHAYLYWVLWGNSPFNIPFCFENDNDSAPHVKIACLFSF